MKGKAPDTLKRLLVDGSQQLGVVLDHGQQEAFMRYLVVLQRWNRTYNLTAVTGEEEIICRHFLDSLSFFPFLTGMSGSVLDLGTGAGFPGLPLALLLPATRFLLVEARQKKILFLQHVTRLLGLENIEILHLHLRKGNGSTMVGKPVEALVSRAVSVPDQVLPVADEVVAPGGLVLLSATASSQEKIVDAISLYENFQLQETSKVTIPFLEQQRYIMRIIKVKDPG